MRKKVQKGGLSHGMADSFQDWESGRGLRPSHVVHKGCGLRTQLGGQKGLVGAPVKGSFGHRPILKNPTYGFTADSTMFKGAPANMASVELGGCPKAGGAKRRKRRTKKRKSKKRRKSKRRVKRKSRKRRKSRSRNKRRKNTKRRLKNKLIGCG